MVAPPDGYKHRRLRVAPRQTKVAGMVRFLRAAWRNGVSRVVDFREEGIAGLRMAREAEIRARALGAPVQVTALGRTTGDESAEEVVRSADGIGLSGLRDLGAVRAEDEARVARRAGRPVAIHFSESRREDVTDLLSLRPALAVHLCKATARDIERVCSARIPVIVCPRSNERFGLRAPVRRMLDSGIRVLLGTDNAMLATPDLFAEARTLVRQGRGRISELEALNAAVMAPQGILEDHPKTVAARGSREWLVVPLRRPSIGRLLRYGPGATPVRRVGTSRRR